MLVKMNNGRASALKSMSVKLARINNIIEQEQNVNLKRLFKASIVNVMVTNLCTCVINEAKDKKSQQRKPENIVLPDCISKELKRALELELVTIELTDDNTIVDAYFWSIMANECYSEMNAIYNRKLNTTARQAANRKIDLLSTVETNPHHQEQADLIPVELKDIIHAEQFLVSPLNTKFIDKTNKTIIRQRDHVDHYVNKHKVDVTYNNEVISAYVEPIKQEPEPKATESMTSKRFLELIGKGPQKSKSVTTKAKSDTPKQQKQIPTIAALNSGLSRNSAAFNSGWKKAKYTVMTVLGNSCACCGKQPGDKHDNNKHVIATGDHVMPFTSNPELRIHPMNVQILCDECNVAKGSDDFTDWRKPEELNKLIKAIYDYEPLDLIETYTLCYHLVYKVDQRSLAIILNTNQTKISRTTQKLKSLNLI